MTREELTHAKAIAGYSAAALEGVYQDLRRQNLRDYSDSETRWKAARMKAVAAARKKIKQP